MNAVVALGKKTDVAARECIAINVEIIVAGERRGLLALVDSGAEDDFISQAVAIELGLKGTPPDSFSKVVNGHRIVLYSQHQLKVHAVDSNDRQLIAACNLYVTDIEGFDMILGIHWLTKVDPDISFRDGTWALRPDAER